MYTLQWYIRGGWQDYANSYSLDSLVELGRGLNGLDGDKVRINTLTGQRVWGIGDATNGSDLK